MVNQAMFANYGLIFGEQLKKLAGGRATAITLVMATNVVVTNSAGLLVGPLLKKMAIRTLCFIAIFLVGSGLIICSFSTEIWHICIGYGVITGMFTNYFLFLSFMYSDRRPMLLLHLPTPH